MFQHFTLKQSSNFIALFLSQSYQKRFNWITRIGGSFLIQVLFTVVRRSQHFSQKYALSPSMISLCTNCSRDASRFPLFTVTGREEKDSSRSKLCEHSSHIFWSTNIPLKVFLNNSAFFNDFKCSSNWSVILV